MPDDGRNDERIERLEKEIKRLKKETEDQSDERAIRERGDIYRLSRVDNKIQSQEIHGNLKGLNSDDHFQYLNDTRHDVSIRHADTVLGTRTIDDTEAPTGNTGGLKDLFSWLGYMIKAITGKENWRTVPATTLDAANTHISAANPHSGSEPSFTKNAAFNKNFGTGEGTVCEGNDSRLSDNRDPNAHDLIDTTGHTVSGLTTGHFLKATGEDTYAFGPHGLTAGDVGALAKQSGSLPAATEGNRGQFFTVEGGTGVADQVYVCIKDDNDDYVWQQII